MRKISNDIAEKLLRAIGQEENEAAAIVLDALLEKEFKEIEMVMEDAREILERMRKRWSFTDNERNLIEGKVQNKLNEIKKEIKIEEGVNDIPSAITQKQ